jgi:hypothetical protein
VQSSRPSFLEILRVLARHDVDFIIVGGVSATLHGLPMATYDLDIVHARDRANLKRLLAALEELDAVYRAQPERRLRPAESHLSSDGHQLLLTNLGPLDVLGQIGKSRRWEDLTAHSHVFEIEPGLTVRVLDLETVITVKEEVGAEKDKAVLPLLRQLLNEKKRS